MTFPSRAFGAGNERRFFDYLRPVNGGGAAAKALKEAIVAAYKAASGEPTTYRRCWHPGSRASLRYAIRIHPV